MNSEFRDLPKMNEKQLSKQSIPTSTHPLVTSTDIRRQMSDQLNLLENDASRTRLDGDVEDDYDDADDDALGAAAARNRTSDVVCSREFFRAVAWRIKSSTSYFVLYVGLILLNGFVLVWEILGMANQDVAIVCEGAVTLMFVAEVGIEILTQRWTPYWSKWSNRIDALVCILCVVLFLVFAAVEEAPDTHHSVENYLDAIVVGIRYAIQAVRLVRFAHRGRENVDHMQAEEVVFDDHVTLSVLHQHRVHNSWPLNRLVHSSTASPKQKQSVPISVINPTKNDQLIATTSDDINAPSIELEPVQVTATEATMATETDEFDDSSSEKQYFHGDITQPSNHRVMQSGGRQRLPSDSPEMLTGHGDPYFYH